MKKLGRTTIESIVARAIQEFLNDSNAPDCVSFFWKDHYVEATIDWSSARCSYYVYDFIVVYSRCVMRYIVDEDFDLSIAWCI